MSGFFDEVNVMIDLETLATRSDAAIVSIGAVKFQFTGGPILDEFKINVDAKLCKDAGLYIDKDTLEWWSKQSKEARMAWMKNPVDITTALNEFRKWYGVKSMHTWSHGASFDQPIMQFAYDKVLKEKTPWFYYHGMCTRTVFNMTGFDQRSMRVQEGNHHDALEDAKAQAKYLIKVLGGEPF